MGHCTRSYRLMRFGASMLAVALTFGLAAEARAQIQTSDQRACILAMNRAAQSIGAEQRLQVLTCIANAQAGLLPPGLSVAECVASPTGKLQQVIAAASDAELRTCLETPDFGYASAQDVSDAILDSEIQLASEIFGYENAESILPLVDRAGSRCQAAVAKDYRRLVAERYRTFITCKTDGLREGRITSAEQLEGCFDAVQEDADGRIQKAFLKLAKDVVKRCAAVDVPTAFPGVCGDSPDFLTCIQERVSCRTCIALNVVDGLNEPCDVLDNGEVDRSCVDPGANECEGENGGHNCDTNASCTDEELGFECTCNDGYRGDGEDCNDVNECRAGGDNNCHVNATCTNKPGGFDCACKAGYAGDGVTCTDQNECAGQGSGNNCSANASCVNVPGSFVCACKLGYAGDGVTCVDVDECLLNTDNCSANGACTNLVGSFACACNPGFSGNGVSCLDLNECIGENGGNNCSANGACLNLPGSFSCSCNSGFSGNGVLCTDLNECQLGTNNCSINANCLNLPGTFSCSCKTGYQGSGITCTDQNECFGQGSGNNCSINANCTNLPGAFSCACKPGFDGNPVGGTCNPINVALTGPTHGSFTTASTTTATGTVTANPISSVTLRINGQVVPINANGTFSASIPLVSANIFNGIRAELTQNATGFTVRDRNVVVWGNSVAMGSTVSQSVGLRVTDRGFNKLEGILAGAVDLDLATLLPVGTLIVDNECFLDSIFGCIMRVTARVSNPPPSLGGFTLNVDSQSNFVDGIITLNNIAVNVQISGGISCGVRISASSAVINGDYLLSPDTVDASNIDVNQNGDVSVSFSNFNRDFTSGVCDWFLIGDIISAIVGDIEPTVRNGLINFLKDPDGAGAGDAPIAQAIEDALTAITLAGPIGQAFGVNLQTPLFNVPEDVNGVTLASNAIMTTLNPLPTTPRFPRTLVVPSSFPFSSLSAVNAPNNQPFGMALAIADTAFNQMLAAQVERGLLGFEVTELEIISGQGPQPITAGLLSVLIPEFGQIDENTPLKVKLQPTLAPVLTGQAGPNGELGVLKISHIQVLVLGPGDVVYGELAADMDATFDMNVGPNNSLVPALGTPDADDISIHLLTNPLGASEAALQGTLLELLLPLIPSLGSELGSFPLPQFLGLTPTPVDITRIGNTGFLGVYMDVQ